MPRIQHPSLGVLDFDEQGAADGKVELRGAEIEFDVWFEDDVNADLLEPVASLVARAEELHEANLVAIRADLGGDDPDSATRAHLDFHLEHLDPDELARVFGVREASRIDAGLYIGALRLRRLGAYPDASSPYLIWDYGFDPNLTDHLVCVVRDLGGEITQVCMES